MATFGTALDQLRKLARSPIVLHEKHIEVFDLGLKGVRSKEQSQRVKIKGQFDGLRLLDSELHTLLQVSDLLLFSLLSKVARFQVAAEQTYGLSEETSLLVVDGEHQHLNYVHQDDSIANALVLLSLQLVFVEDFVGALNETDLHVLEILGAHFLLSGLVELT